MDVIIAIDTSGSMVSELHDVVAWLAEVEVSLRTLGADFQMLVVADHLSLAQARPRRPNWAAAASDAGQVDAGRIQASIGSRDALDTLIASAREGPPPRWPELLRMTSAKHVVIVTDDEAIDEQGLPYLSLLASAASGLLGAPENPNFSLHLLGGFEPPRRDEVLGPAEPLATSRCRGGVAPGLAYQRIARATGGLRASLCHPESYRALAKALSQWPIPTVPVSCMWLLRPGVDGRTLYEARALRGAQSLRLWEAASANSCTGRHDAYVTSGQMFALCSATCASLADAGYQAVRLSTRCGG